MARIARATCVVIVLVSASEIAAVRAEEDAWADFRFLIGSWVSAGRPEEGSGSFTLESALGGKILVRRNVANVPAAKGRPAAKHEDLMIVHQEPGAKGFRASYYDNEGHVIHYTVSALPDKKGLVFLSDADRPAPRFRLTYTKGKEDQVAVKFEIAPPGQADQFKTYLEGTVRRKQPNK